VKAAAITRDPFFMHGSRSIQNARFTLQGITGKGAHMLIDRSADHGEAGQRIVAAA
jgi:hypothetical protein